MAQTIVGMFKYKEGVESAVKELKDLKYNLSQFSILMKDVEVAKGELESTSQQVAKGTVSGAMVGGVLAGIAGFLVGIGVLVIPGLGPLLGAGPLASALGLTGAAATATTAAVSGLLAGGLVGGLMKVGFPEEEARKYEEYIRAGGILLLVPVRDARTDEVRNILSKHGATDVRQLELHANIEEFKQ